MIKVATLWLLDEKGEILLAQRAHTKANDPSTWGPSVTGRLEPGETYDQALAREVEEELGLKPNEYEPVFLIEKQYADHPDGEPRVFCTYYARLPRAKAAGLRFDRDEVAALKWLPVDIIMDKMRAAPAELVPSATAIWEDTFQALRNAKVVSVRS